MRILMVEQTPPISSANAIYDRSTVERLLNTYASPGTQVELAALDEFEGAGVLDALGKAGALNGLQHTFTAPAIVRKIVWAAANGYDAVISSNTFDPGVEGARLAVRIPVVGLLRTSMHVALTLADRVGILVPLATHIPFTRRLLRSYGLEHAVSDVRAIGVYNSNIRDQANEIMSTTVERIRDLITETGAEIILPLGGALIPYVVDPKELAKASGAEVLNTKAIGIRFAETCVALSLTHSAIAYPGVAMDPTAFGKRQDG
jgi:Asp/Glu/hydantoin racemase